MHEWKGPRKFQGLHAGMGWPRPSFPLSHNFTHYSKRYTDINRNMCRKPNIHEAASSVASEIKRSKGFVKAKQIEAQQPPLVPPSTCATKQTNQYGWALLFPLAGVFCFSSAPARSIVVIAVSRFIAVHLALSLHYQLVHKDNYEEKPSQNDLNRERRFYCTSIWNQMFLLLLLQQATSLMLPTQQPVAIFQPVMVDLVQLAIAHGLAVEPLYYFANRLLCTLRTRHQTKESHQESSSHIPTTAFFRSLPENLLIICCIFSTLITAFGMFGHHSWAAVGLYLIGFDLADMYGHSQIRVSSPLFTHKVSPLKYILLTSDFRLGHHAYSTGNFSLFMPLWDHVFGTYREYRQRNESALLPASQQDFVFIVHPSGTGLAATLPEVCYYQVYDEYPQILPFWLDTLVLKFVCTIARSVAGFKCYYGSRFCIGNEYVGRLACLARGPYDYLKPACHAQVNQDIIDLIRKEHQTKGTRCFGLGNLNKMKQLNDGGIEIVEAIRQDPYLRDKQIRVWTGDTMTSASIYNQILDIPDLTELYYIGAGGKVGTAVVEMLLENKPDLRVTIFSRNVVFHHDRVTYSTDLSDLCDYKYVVVGKILSEKMYAKAFAKREVCNTRYMLDYTVPLLPIKPALMRPEKIKHVRIGLLRAVGGSRNKFLKGNYDVCMSHDQHHIVPCHFGCLLRTVSNCETDEVGPVDHNEVEKLWKMALSRGFRNVDIQYE
jgi:sterol desaturase/sphingolipid hydroxylase (fatty acid hydroxylase superfamily)